MTGYALFSCDFLLQNNSISIIAAMTMISTAAPTAAPIITPPLRDPELPPVLTEDVDDFYNTH